MRAGCLGSKNLVILRHDQINGLDHWFSGPTCIKSISIETRQVLGLQDHTIHNML